MQIRVAEGVHADPARRVLALSYRKGKVNMEAAAKCLSTAHRRITIKDCRHREPDLEDGDSVDLNLCAARDLSILLFKYS